MRRQDRAVSLSASSFEWNENRVAEPPAFAGYSDRATHNAVVAAAATDPEIMGNYYQNLRGNPYERDPDQSYPT
jgi:hypothetical protein